MSWIGIGIVLAGAFIGGGLKDVAEAIERLAAVWRFK